MIDIIDLIAVGFVSGIGSTLSNFIFYELIIKKLKGKA